MSQRYLCYYCGKDRLYFQKRSRLWICLNADCTHYNKPVTHVSGPKLKDELVEHHQRMSHRKKGPTGYQNKRRLHWSWVFLLFVLYVGIGIIIYVTNRLLSHHINFIAGISIITATAFVILYNASAIIKWYKRVRPRRIATAIISFVLIGCVMLAYTGVAPFSTAKDDIVSFIHNVNQDSGTSSNGSEATPTSTYTSGTTATPRITPTKTPTPTPTPQWTGPNGEKEHEYVSCGAYCYYVGGDGENIELFNNPQAHDPSWDELVTFLASDDTDEHDYIYGAFVCADFAEMLHNNAETFGIRAAYVLIDLSGYSDPYNYGIPSNTGHALNAFSTTDMGLVYIDCTGTSSYFPCSSDTTIVVSVGSEYIPESIFPCAGWSSTWESMGTVTDIDIQW